jgi:Phage tail tube protein
MANFSTSFGYNFYIVPLASADVDVSFSGVTQAISATTPLSKSISNVARTDNIVTVTTSASHGFSVGNTVVVTAVTNTGINGTFTIVDVPTAATFTYVKTGADITSGADTGTAVIQNASSGGFISTASVIPTGATVSYSNGIFTVEGSTFDMDGTDNPARIVGLTNAALETDTDTEDLITYDDETKGYNISLPTAKTWSISLAGVADFRDAGYHILRLTEQNTVADSLRVKIVRIGPTGTDEAVYGYGTINGYTESIEAGSIATWEATIQGYGPYRIDPDVNP